jgi:hypothetical protein
MNHNEKLLEKINGRMSESKVCILMQNFIVGVSLYPASQVECKDKRVRVVEKASSELYPLHSGFTVPFNDYGNSVVLIGNDMPVKHMINEVAQFIVHLENFINGIKKANGVQELKAYYDQFKTAPKQLKPKQLVDALMEDLELYSVRYGFELNKREVADGVAACKVEFSAYLVAEKKKLLALG